MKRDAEFKSIAAEVTQLLLDTPVGANAAAHRSLTNLLDQLKSVYCVPFGQYDLANFAMWAGRMFKADRSDIDHSDVQIRTFALADLKRLEMHWDRWITG